MEIAHFREMASICRLLRHNRRPCYGALNTTKNVLRSSPDEPVSIQFRQRRPFGLRARRTVWTGQCSASSPTDADDGPDYLDLRRRGHAWKGPCRSRVRYHTRSLVLRLPLSRQPDHARLPRPRRPLAIDRLQPRLAGVARAAAMRLASAKSN